MKPKEADQNGKRENRISDREENPDSGNEHAENGETRLDLLQWYLKMILESEDDRGR